jgi:hypothetical protein
MSAPESRRPPDRKPCPLRRFRPRSAAFVIHDDVRPEPANELDVLSGNSSRHVRSLDLGKLDGEVPHSAGAAVYENTLTFSELSVLEQALPRGQCRQGNSRRLNEINATRLRAPSRSL